MDLFVTRDSDQVYQKGQQTLAVGIPDKLDDQTDKCPSLTRLRSQEDLVERSSRTSSSSSNKSGSYVPSCDSSSSGYSSYQKSKKDQQNNESEEPYKSRQTEHHHISEDCENRPNGLDNERIKSQRPSSSNEPRRSRKNSSHKLESRDEVRFCKLDLNKFFFLDDISKIYYMRVTEVILIDKTLLVIYQSYRNVTFVVPRSFNFYDDNDFGIDHDTNRYMYF